MCPSINVTESKHRGSQAWYPSTWASWTHGAVWRGMESESGRVNNAYSPTYHRLLIIIQKQRKGMLAKIKSDPKHGKNIVYTLFKTLFLTEQILKTIELVSHRNQMQRFSRHTMISITDSLQLSCKLGSRNFFIFPSPLPEIYLLNEWVNEKNESTL